MVSDLSVFMFLFKGERIGNGFECYDFVEWRD